MKFRYLAKDNAGNFKKGIVEATSKTSAVGVLSRHNLTVVSLEVVKEVPLLSSIIKIWEGTRTRDFIIFSRQLAVMIDSKVPLLTALNTIADQTENRFLAMKIKSIVADVDSGMSFSESIAKHPDTFSKFYVNMVKAGEASGTLQQNLNNLADNLEKNYELTAKLKGALYYPGFILFAMFAVGFIVMTFVMPKLLVILEESNIELPLTTKILIAVSGFLASYWWIVFLVIIAAIIGFFYYIKTEQGKIELDYLILKIPIIKKLVNNVFITRFTENFSTLLQSGLPITTALLITSEIVGNERYRDAILDAVQEVKKGGSVSDALKKHKVIPLVVVQMIKIGEATGRVDFALKKITEFYIKETDRVVKNFSSLIEPVLMVLLAVGVGILVSAVILPIYQVATSIQ